MDFLNAIRPLSFRAKLALPLVYSEHVIWTHPLTEHQAQTLNQGLAATWQWIEDQSNTALDIYQTIYPMLRFTEGSPDEKFLNAVSSVISAVYYAAWKADGYDFTNLGRDNSAFYGGDFFEVTKQMALDARDFAILAAHDADKEKVWQEAVLHHYLTYYQAETLGELGPKITRETWGNQNLK